MSVPSRSRPVVSQQENAPEPAADEIEQASLEVDPTLLRWSTGLTIRARLRAATRAARMLGRFRRVGTPRAG